MSNAGTAMLVRALWAGGGPTARCLQRRSGAPSGRLRSALSNPAAGRRRPPPRGSQGVGMATGKDRAEQAALAATSAPLIQRSVERATGGERAVRLGGSGGAAARPAAQPAPSPSSPRAHIPCSSSSAPPPAARHCVQHHGRPRPHPVRGQPRQRGGHVAGRPRRQHYLWLRRGRQVRGGWGWGPLCRRAAARACWYAAFLYTMSTHAHTTHTHTHTQRTRRH